MTLGMAWCLGIFGTVISIAVMILITYLENDYNKHRKK